MKTKKLTKPEKPKKLDESRRRKRGRGRAGRRAALGTAVLVLGALLAACGGGSAGSAGSDGSVGADGSAASADAAGAPDGAAREASPAPARDGGRATGGRVVNVEVVTLGAEPFTETIRVTGVAEANRDVTLSAEESGRIRALPVEKGSPVSGGDVVARIDGTILSAEVGQARAQAELARERFERQQQLFEEERAISEITFLEARYAAEEARERLASLEERLARTRVRVPFAGVLDDRLVELGSMVSPGTAVARLVDLDPIRVSGGVPERYAPDVAVGTEATVRFDVLPDTAFRARLAYVGATVDRESRTVPVEFTVRNPGRMVKPEMVANIEIVRRELAGAVVVPRDALVRREDGFAAFVVVEGGDGPVARARSLEVGPAREDRVVIRSGLEAGDRLVVVGQDQVAEGDRVRVVGTGRLAASGPRGEERR